MRYVRFAAGIDQAYAVDCETNKVAEYSYNTERCITHLVYLIGSVFTVAISGFLIQQLVKVEVLNNWQVVLWVYACSVCLVGFVKHWEHRLVSLYLSSLNYTECYYNCREKISSSFDKISARRDTRDYVHKMNNAVMTITIIMLIFTVRDINESIEILTYLTGLILIAGFTEITEEDTHRAVIMAQIKCLGDL